MSGWLDEHFFCVWILAPNSVLMEHILLISYFLFVHFREQSWQDYWTSKARRGNWAGRDQNNCCITIWIYCEAWRCGVILWSICQGNISIECHGLHSNIITWKHYVYSPYPLSSDTVCKFIKSLNPKLSIISMAMLLVIIRLPSAFKDDSGIWFRWSIFECFRLYILSTNFFWKIVLKVEKVLIIWFILHNKKWEFLVSVSDQQC